VRHSPRERTALFTHDRTGAWDPTGGAGYGYYRS